MDNKNEKDLKLSSEAQMNETAKEIEVEENKIQIISPGKMVLKRFFRSRLSVIGLVTLILLFTFSFLGPIFTNLAWGWKEDTVDKRMTAAEVLDIGIDYSEKIISDATLYEIAEAYDISVDTTKTGISYLPSIYDAYRNDSNGMYGHYTTSSGEVIHFEIINDSNVYTAFLLSETIINEGTPYEFATYSRIVTSVIKRTSNPKDINLNALPTSDHWLGTDANGFDVFSRLMYAGRISLTLGFVVVIISVVLGILLGGIAGYFGKWADMIVMRVVDVLNCLPSLPLMLIYSAILDGMNIDEGIRIYFLMALLALTGWTGTARMVRGQILMLREQEFMVAAEALGISVPRRIIKHLLPNIMPILIVGMTLSLGSTILTEASLSYLGLGIRHPKAAWGTMISSANDPTILQYYPNQWVPAGVMIILAVLAFNFVGDGLRDAFDPKMRR